MRRLDRAEIVRFLHAVDDSLEDNLVICVIGGVAAVIGYNANVKTADIDVFTIAEGTAADMMQATRSAAALTGLSMMVDRASIAELPYNYEDRVRVARGARFKKLVVMVPDKYDLALSKTLRCYEHDLEAIKSIHVRHPFSEKTLASRFENEIWKIATTNPRSFAFSMTIVMEMLFGKKRAEFYRARWGVG